LFRGQHPIGVLDVQHTKANHFDVNEIRTLQIVASQLSVALTNAQLFAENARRLAIIEHSSDLVALVDLGDGFIIDINPAGIHLAGYNQPEEILYKPLAEILPYDNLKQVEEEGIPTALEQGAWRGESLICSVDGTIIPVAQTIFVILNDEGQPHMLAVIMSDITKRKQAEEERERLFEEVKAGRERLQVLSHRLVEVQEAERRHIARELHDEVGQLLTGLKLTLEMSSSLPADVTKTSLREAQTLVNELIGQVRELSLELRPAMLDDLGLLPTLQWLFERYTTQTQVQVAFKHTGLNQRFAPAAETAAYRIMQEALTNVARYAGVESVQVEVWTTETMLNVQVEDHGVGFDPEDIQAVADTSGLSGMSERAALLGGNLTVESVPQGGTRLRAELPLRIPVEDNT
jgi:PAS domain S-box-containing protein